MIPVRLLSSVAVVGRDNEPIYLRGDLCDCNNNNDNQTIAKQINDNKAQISENKEESSIVVTEDEGGDDTTTTTNINQGDDDGDTINTDDTGDAATKKQGLLGRIKTLGRRNSNDHDDEDIDKANEGEESQQRDENNISDDDDDPFGFFGNDESITTLSSTNTTNIPAMSLTQQLVLHAALDRFEEQASRSNKGGAVRWRTPGSNSANAMWMGMLCQVEDRWNVYGYLTNTGIKFMILVENIYLNPEDGSRLRHDQQNNNTLFPSMPVSDTNSSSREADLKRMFAQLHELYVRYTMNPFSQLRSPIQSKVFDKGIVNMASSFNSAALDQSSSGQEGEGKDGLNWM